MTVAVPSAVQANGHGPGLKKDPQPAARVASPEDEKVVINTIRCLAADLCQEVSQDFGYGSTWSRVES
jgi:dihydroxyacetone synthase